MAKNEVLMPALGMAMTHGTLLSWRKNPGDPVEVGDIVAEVETDKANLELESEHSGFLGTPLFAEGDAVPVGAAIVEIVDATEAAPAAKAGTTKPGRGVQSRKSKEVAANTVATANPASFRQQAVLVDEASDSKEVDLAGLPAEQLLEWLEAMTLIREFETASDRLALMGKIPGGMHSAAGQEAVAVGSVRALAPTDIVTSSHRSHHHSLAKGLPPRAVMAELYGKETGVLGGRGGHMHLADFNIGLFGSNGIVGGGLGLAMGASLAAKMRGLEQVALGFFGDGGANTGRVWESINLAALWKLPLIIVCENNLYAVETHVARATAADTIAGRAAGFGLPAVQIDGQDVVAVHKAIAQARERAQSGGGPTFVEALTYRYKGHNTGDRETYRTKDEVEDWRSTKDPISRLAGAMEKEGMLPEGRLAELVENARQTVAEAVTFAEDSPWPDRGRAAEQVTGFADRTASASSLGR